MFQFEMNHLNWFNFKYLKIISKLNKNALFSYKKHCKPFLEANWACTPLSIPSVLARFLRTRLLLLSAHPLNKNKVKQFQNNPKQIAAAKLNQLFFVSFLDFFTQYFFLAELSSLNLLF